MDDTVYTYKVLKQVNSPSEITVASHTHTPAPASRDPPDTATTTTTTTTTRNDHEKHPAFERVETTRGATSRRR